MVRRHAGPRRAGEPRPASPAPSPVAELADAGRRRRRAAAGGRGADRCAPRPARPRCCGTATSPSSTTSRAPRCACCWPRSTCGCRCAGPPRRRPVAPRRAGRPPHAARGAAPRRRARAAAAPPRAPQAAAGGAAGRRVRLDGAVRRRAAAPRARLGPRRRRPGTSRVEVFTIGTRLTRVTAGAWRTATSSRRCGAAGEQVPDWSGGTRLGRGAEGVPRPLGTARGGARRGRRDLLRRLGARGPRAARPSRCSGCPGWPTGWSGSTRTAARTGYQPVQGGIAAALPYVDDFVAGHSLGAFAELMEVVARA